MDVLAYSLSCRTCRETDGRRRAYDFTGQQAGQPLAALCEVGLVQVLEQLNEQQQVRCPFCGAASLEVVNLTLNEQPIFDYEQVCRRCDEYGLAALSLTVEKTSAEFRTHLTVHPTRVPAGFAHLALDNLAELVAGRPAHDFAPDPTGSFYACTVGYWQPDGPEKLVLPQRFTCRGLTREEVLFVIESMRGRLDIS